MKRRAFSRGDKLEAVRQVRERGVSSGVVAKELGIGANVLGRWVREASGDVRKAANTPVSSSSSCSHSTA